MGMFDGFFEGDSEFQKYYSPFASSGHSKKRAESLSERVNKGRRGPDYASSGGTGAGFLGGFDLKGLQSGSFFEDRGPQATRDFLLGEFGPGGYLAPAQQSLENAAGIRGLFNQGRQQFSNALSQASASGLSRRYAVPAAVQRYGETTSLANEMLSAGMGETNRRRFEAMRAYVNQASQSAFAGKTAEANTLLAQSGAFQAQGGAGQGGLMSMIGGIFGG